VTTVSPHCTAAYRGDDLICRQRTVSISGEADFNQLDDSALISLREEMRAELERHPACSADHAELATRYDLTTVEINERARAAWSRTI
jgi:hypothetical protein